jgi:hypothetical protein
MATELSTMGQSLVIPALSEKIRELFGFDFSGLLKELGGTGNSKAKGRKKAGQKSSAKQKAGSAKKNRSRG